MKNSDIAHARLQNQQLSWQHLNKPADVMQWLDAVKTQEYNGAKWALDLRLKNATDESIEKAFADGEILRTHVMRPTWHFVARADIRWLLKLTAARVNMRNAYYYRQLELDDGVFKRTNKALANALRGGKQLTRESLRIAVQRSGVAADDLLRFIHILARAELDGVICSGARVGRQFTYALLAERAPETRTLTPDESLAELTRRYFTSHGPATMRDFVWWSGLTASEATRGLEMVGSLLVKEVIEGTPYWYSPSSPLIKRPTRVVQLLPPFDEYLVAYKDRRAALDPKDSTPEGRGNAVLGSQIVMNGRVVGTWARTLKKQKVIITLAPFAPFSKPETRVVADAAQRYGAFLGLNAVVAG